MLNTNELSKEVVNQEVVDAGVRDGSSDVVRPDIVREEVRQTGNIIGATAEANDLMSITLSLKRQLKHTRIVALFVWLLFTVVVISRFMM